MPPESDRRLRHNVRLDRLLRFLELVSGRGRWNPKTLAAELEVSERTVHRLRETLELVGVPTAYERAENAYRVHGSYRFPALHLTVDEAFGQAAATALGETDELKLPRGSADTTRKLAQTGTERLRRILTDASKLMTVLGLKLADHPQQRERIATVQKALVKRKRLSGTYRSPYEPGPVTLDLHPCRIALVKEAWYVIARPEGGEQPRTYRIVRFHSLAGTDHPAVVPDAFDLKTYFGNAWAVYRGDRCHDIELRFTADAAAPVLEHVWHRTQTVEHHAEGDVTLRFTVDGLDEILRWVLGWAGRVRVVKPAELRELVVEHHRNAVVRNEEGN